MSARIELDPVARVTAAAVGEPGQRTFYLQARKDDVVVTLLIEKQQVALLSMHIDELLERVGTPDDQGDPEELDLEEPVTPAFRVGQIGLGYDEGRDLVLLQCDEYVSEDEEGEPVVRGSDDLGRVRLWATRAQASALARRGEHEVASGRPVCPMCGEAMEPDGHFCIRSNGHRKVTRLS
ncbi:MAG: DUF3090 domain-containing protein [Actinomycetota bacterium]